MPRKHFSPEQVINKLQEAEVLFCQGKMMAGLCRGLNVTEQT